MLFELYTLGCKVNRYESDCLRSELISRGHKPCDDNAPELIIVNSCTVTAYSDKKTRQTLSMYRKKYPDATIVLAGCMPQAFPEKVGRLDSADIIVGTKNKTELITLAEQFVRNRERLVSVSPYDGSESFDAISCADFEGKTRAEIKIEDGCNCFCSYCIIPYARGRVRSKLPEQLAREAERIAEAGYREIVLTGINLAAYGSDFSDGTDIADAVRLCSAPDGIARVRLGSLEADLLDDSLIKKLADNPKLCPHFHLSLQSGCKKTLAEMNRSYTPEGFSKLADCLRRSFPDCALTTDIIAGFPGETDEDFAQSLEFFSGMKFAQSHVFPYSAREGTRAAARTDTVAESVKTKRAALLRAAGEEMRENFLKSRVGMTVPVLFEHENEAGFHRGHAPDYTPVKIPATKSGKSLQNQLIYVTIKKYAYNVCLGDIADGTKIY